MRKTTSGFTIVELLIVIVVIGVLAAISIVAFNGIQDRGYDAAIQSDVKNLATKVRLYHAENGIFPTTNAHFSVMGLGVNKNSYDHYFNGSSYYNLLYCWRPLVNPNEFAIIAYGKSKHYKYDTSGRLSEFTLGKVGSAAACPDAGVILDTGNERYFFYDAGNWRSFL